MCYKDKMAALLNSFRLAFRNPELPMYFVQLAPYAYEKKFDSQALPRLWEAQQAFAESDPFVGMAVINDVGDIHDIHPRNKQTVGRRLALLAFNKTYGMKGCKAFSPVLDSFKVDGCRMVLTFRNTEQLKTRDGKAPSHFELAGADSVFFPAQAVIDNNKIVLTSNNVPKPALVRYAWHQQAEPNVRNEADLQLGSFRAGEVTERTLLDSLVPEAAGYKLVYRLNPLAPGANAEGVTYLRDNSRELRGKIKRIAYFLYLLKENGIREYVFVSMDPFTQEFGKIGVPTFASRTVFQCQVKKLEVKSNVVHVKTGSFAVGNLEFWSSGYGPENAAKVPGANGETLDFGDRYAGHGIDRNAHGSMQVHNTTEKQTVFAYNNWKANRNCDLGIGNHSGRNTDWTFAGNGNCRQADLLVLVEME